jgi:uncharacterized protein (DUF983 family)
VKGNNRVEQEATMHTHQTRHDTQSLARVLPRARCPNCGEALLIAQASEFVAGGEIRHHWACDACGEDFSTVVVMPRH